MTRLLSILLFVSTFSLVSNKTDSDIDTEKYLNFLAAVNRSSTFNYFTVIRVKNLNTGLTKEICTKGDCISYALHMELKAGYDEEGKQKVLEFVKANKDRYFELKSKKALHLISFADYDTTQLYKIQDKYDFDKAVEIIKNDKNFALELSDKEMKYFAHVLFNKGYMTGESDCFGGTLVYVDRTKRK
jgi:hypothetical protein